MGKHLTLSSLQTILPPIKHLIDKKAENVDWNENDPNAKGYVKNRPFYIENENGKVLLDETFTIQDDSGLAAIDYFEIIEGEKYLVTFNGVEYSTIGKYFQEDDFSCYYLGNGGLGFGLDDTGEPFFIGLMPGNSAILSDIQEFTITVKSYAKKYHKIDPKFLPEVETAMIVKGPDVTTYTAEALKASKTAKEIYEAYTSGKQVYFRYTNDFPFIPLVACTETEAVFVGNCIDGISGTIPKDAMSYEVSQDAFRVYENGDIEIFPADIATLSNQLNNKVPNNRTINGHLLQSNITLTAADVGAATEQYVDNAVANLVDSSPDTLNTLNELAAALGDDPNFATTVTTELGKKSTATNLVNGSAMGSLRAVGAKMEDGTYKLGLNAFAEGNNTVASGTSSHAEGYGTTASDGGAHAEGRNTTASGGSSHAEGAGTIASGQQSHAEGYETFTYGTGSHAEGRDTSNTITITGEGNATTYTISANHASRVKIDDVITIDKTIFASIIDKTETSITVNSTLSSQAQTQVTATIYSQGAFGNFSHAEGDQTTTKGSASHAEGLFTIANGSYSHVEGGYTVASGIYQHVQGKYNIEDAIDTYAHIVGNGENVLRRSNAHTLDWSGNAWYQGDVYVGGSGQDDAAAEKLATENYVDNRISEIGGIPILTDSVTGINYELFVENGTLGMKKTDILGGKVRLKDSATDKNYELYVTNGQLSMKEVE